VLGVHTVATGGGGHPPPGDPRPHAVGGLQGVQGPPLPQLAPAQADVDVASRLPARVRIANQRDELAQRLAHAGADRNPKAALQRTGVFGDLAGDRCQDLFGRLRELRLDRIGKLRREGVPRLLSGVFCHLYDKK
jgi:hypothetical protein